MTFFDWMIIISCVSAGVGGFRVGFVARMASWMGTIVGLGVALAVLPAILRNVNDMTAISRLGIVILIALAGLLLGQMVGLFAGSRLAASLPPGPVRTGDQLVGGIAGAAGVLLFLWLMVPTAAAVPGWTAQQVRGSLLAQNLYNNTPRPPDFTNTLRRLVGTTSFPQVFNDLQPADDTGPAPSVVRIAGNALERAKASTVKVEGTACRRTQDGSGFVAGPGLIVTNAHVVAGERSTKVFDFAGEVHVATVVLYDPARDLALLRVPTMSASALPISRGDVGDEGAVLGHPGGQDELAIAPAAVRRQIVAVGRDLYDQQVTRRDVLVLAAQLAQGDSGGPLVNGNGEVIGVAFAIAPDKPGTAYALDTTELNAVLNQAGTSAVSTGACIND